MYVCRCEIPKFSKPDKTPNYPRILIRFLPTSSRWLLGWSVSPDKRRKRKARIQDRRNLGFTNNVGISKYLHDGCRLNIWRNSLIFIGAGGGGDHIQESDNERFTQWKILLGLIYLISHWCLSTWQWESPLAYRCYNGENAGTSGSTWNRSNPSWHVAN